METTAEIRVRQLETQIALQKHVYERCLGERGNLEVQNEMLALLLKDTVRTLDMLLSVSRVPHDAHHVGSELIRRIQEALRNSG